MRGITFLIAALLLITSCNSDDTQEKVKEKVSQTLAESDKYYGQSFSAGDAKKPAMVLTKLEDVDSVKIALKGEVLEVCQKKGCWMTMSLNDTTTMRITFKDYGFFVPKDLSGKQVVINGYAKKELVDIESLKHFAEDEGKSEEEINAITTGERKYTFLASGVKLIETDSL